MNSNFEHPDGIVFQIQKITYVVGKDKAVGTLFPGAIIDGKPVSFIHFLFFRSKFSVMFSVLLT